MRKDFTKGGHVDMVCTFTEEFKHRPKYLCKLDDTLTCSPLTPSLNTKRKYTVFQSQDNLLQMNISFHNLEKSDAGDYWCGVSDTNDHFLVLMTNLKLVYGE